MTRVSVQVGVLLRRRKWDLRIAFRGTLGLLTQHFVHRTVKDLRRLTETDVETETETTHAAQEDVKCLDAATVLDVLLALVVETLLEKGTLLAAYGRKLGDVASGSVEDPQPMRSLSVLECNQLKRKQRSYEKKHPMAGDPTADTSADRDVFHWTDRKRKTKDVIDVPIFSMADGHSCLSLSEASSVRSMSWSGVTIV